jgi:hypothetical protein
MNKVVPSDYGFTVVEAQDSTVILFQADGSWILSLTPLASVSDGSVLCFADRAANGGSYNSQRPIHVTQEPKGTFIAEVVREPVEGCPVR